MIDVVFLDIEMPKMNDFSAIDYLLKPTDVKDLQAAVQKVERSRKIDTRQMELLNHYLVPAPKTFPEKIVLSHHDRVVFVELKNILYCEADDNYPRFYLSNGQKYLISKTLRDIQEVLEERNFLRVSRQHLINLDHIAKFIKGEGSYVVLSNGQSINVARSQKDKLIERFGWL